jgi:hypothetical protein
MTQSSLPLDPHPIASRWTVAKRHTYELVRRDGLDFVMRLVGGVTPESEREGYRVGDEIRVEADWFVVRGDVRRVS